jgi:hypothetical protein
VTIFLGMMAHACNSSTREMEVEGGWGTPGQPGLCSETLSPKEKIKTKKGWWCSTFLASTKSWLWSPASQANKTEHKIDTSPDEKVNNWVLQLLVVIHKSTSTLSTNLCNSAIPLLYTYPNEIKSCHTKVNRIYFFMVWNFT